MSKLSPQLFAQLGGTHWVSRQGVFPSVVTDEAKVSHDVSIGEIDTADQQAESAEISNSQSAKLSGHEIQTPEHGFIKSDEVIVDSASGVTAVTAALENGVVLLGAGLDHVWQDETSPAWRLWQNIMFAFGWEDSQVVFYDLDNLATEEMMATTLEEIIGLGAEWVITMQSDHEFNELLAEGMQVVEVPDFEMMLFDPYAKQSFYQTLVNLTN